jgi:hypothetical protein
LSAGMSAANDHNRLCVHPLPTLDLPCRYVHSQAFKLWRDPNLAGQATGGTALVGDEIQHVRFGCFWGWQQRPLGGVNVTVAGAAGARSTAFGQQTIDTVLHRDLQQGLAFRGLRVILAAIGKGEIDQGHG